MDPVITELYHGPMESFIDRRGSIARSVRVRDAAAAAAIARLRKPSVTTWAIDQVAFDEPKLIAELLAAGADARDVQQAAGAGEVTGEVLRKATERVRRLVDTVATAARSVLERAGHSAAEEADRRIRTTLQAAASGGRDDRLALWHGTLERDLGPAGFVGAEEFGEDPPELAEALAPLRDRTPDLGAHKPAPRGSRRSAGDRAAERRAADLHEAAQRARLLAEAKRDRADHLSEAARLAEEEAVRATRAADAAEEAARAASRP